MKSLIVEDEFTSRMQLKYFLEEHGSCDIAVNGEEALVALDLAYKGNNPYNLICLDVKMPGMDGNDLLQKIREIEEQRGIAASDRVKIFMATGVVDPKSDKPRNQRPLKAFLRIPAACLIFPAPRKTLENF